MFNKTIAIITDCDGPSGVAQSIKNDLMYVFGTAIEIHTYFINKLTEGVVIDMRMLF